MNEARYRYEQLALGLQKPVYNAAARLTGSPEDGLDLARETFVRAYSRYVSHNRPGLFRPMVYQVMMEIYGERLGAAPPAPRWLDSAADLEEGVGEALRIGLSFFAGDRLDSSPVDDAMANLPRDLRVVLLLCDAEGFSYAQVSRMVGRSKLWVAGNLYMARRSLRAVLRKQPRRRPPIER